MAIALASRRRITGRRTDATIRVSQPLLLLFLLSQYSGFDVEVWREGEWRAARQARIVWQHCRIAEDCPH